MSAAVCVWFNVSVCAMSHIVVQMGHHGDQSHIIRTWWVVSVSWGAEEGWRGRVEKHVSVSAPKLQRILHTPQKAQKSSSVMFVSSLWSSSLKKNKTPSTLKFVICLHCKASDLDYMDLYWSLEKSSLSSADSGDMCTTLMIMVVVSSADKA